MKLIRSTKALTIGDRSKRQAVIAIAVTDYTWQEKLNRYLITVEDCEVVDSGNTEPGSPLKNYISIGTKPVARTKKEVNDLFNYFAVDIMNGDDFTEKLRELIVKGLLLDTQVNPIYNSTGADWEIVDTSFEVAPGEPPIIEE